MHLFIWLAALPLCIFLTRATLVGIYGFSNSFLCSFLCAFLRAYNYIHLTVVIVRESWFYLFYFLDCIRRDIPITRSFRLFLTTPHSPGHAYWPHISIAAYFLCFFVTSLRLFSRIDNLIEYFVFWFFLLSYLVFVTFKSSAVDCHPGALVFFCDAFPVFQHFSGIILLNFFIAVLERDLGFTLNRRN